MSANDKAFTGAVPQIYETLLVPLIFEPYAADLVRRLAPRKPARILEVAAGTGVVTRAMLVGLGDKTTIIATDLNQAMLDQAATVGTPRPIEWRQADALQLPFPDGSFDAVVCQFGVMFYPDRPRAHAEARRVLKAGGVYVFNVWDRLADNEFPDTISGALEALFPQDPPRFLPRTPYGYNDHALIHGDLGKGGFTRPATIDTVPARSRASSPDAPATAFCQGTPLRAEIEARGELGAATEAASQAIARRFGSGAVDAKIQALVVTVER